MIRLKNRAEEYFVLKSMGTQASSATAVDGFICPYLNGYVKAVLARLRTSGNGNETVEIRKNGTSIAGAATPVLTFANGQTVPTYNVGTTQVTIVKGDVITAVITAVPGSPGADLVVEVSIGKLREVFPGDGQAPQTDTLLGADAELYS